MPEATAVAIVGGGPAALLLAAELGMRGVPTIVLGETAGTSTHPKANTHGARSMEIYRKHGVSAALRAASPSKRSRTDVAYYTRLLGYELHRVPLPTPSESIDETRSASTRWPTAEPQFRSSQLVLEPLLLARAQQFPSVDVRYQHRVVALADLGSHVNLCVETPSGEQVTVRAAYVVGCDGGRSFVRRAIGLRLMGEGGVDLDFMGGRIVSTYFRAAGLHARLRHPHSWQNWFMLPHLRALMLTLDAEDDRYLLHYQLPTQGGGKCFGDVLAEIVGAPVSADVISSAEWRAGVSLVAEKYRVGRAFIAGDAAHLFTPTGGFGLNTGIEDAYNLGWKLAAVHDGWAPESLLDSYEVERRPIAERNTQYALSLARRDGECPVGADIEDEGPGGEMARAAAGDYLKQYARWEFDTPGIQLGASYRHSPAIVDDDAPPQPDSPIEYVPNAVPGSRLPHVWLSDETSLYDRLGPEFTLIRLDASAAFAGWTTVAAERGVPLTVLDLCGNAELRALGGASLILVRPDQHVAWRGDVADPKTILATVTGCSAQRTLTKTS